MLPYLCTPGSRLLLLPPPPLLPPLLLLSSAAMSTQPRDLLKAKLSLQRDASMPAAPPRLDALSEDDAEPDDLSDFPPSPLQDDSSSASSASSTSTIRPLFPPRHQYVRAVELSIPR